MKILISLTYYRPHTSGLTIYAERLAKAFVKNGHEVTILTSRYEKRLSKDEVIDGVRIIRVPVIFRVSKGVVMPSLALALVKEIPKHDVVQVHLPQFDAAAVAFWSKLFGKPTILTYHCDLIMPRGCLSWIANQTVHLMNHISALLSDRIVTYTQDYANHSPFLKHYLKKLSVVQPPVELPPVSKEQTLEFGRRHNPGGRHPVIGMAARFATEKGVEVLIKALPLVQKAYPDALVQFAGPFEKIVGEEQYADRLRPLIRALESRGEWQFLGVLDEMEMARFYANIELLVIPSLNSTEAFGLVQIEAMMMGKPVIVSDLPGVRQPTQWHHMGEVVSTGDATKLGDAIQRMLKEITRYRIDPGELIAHYSPIAIASEYERLFLEILKKKRRER